MSDEYFWDGKSEDELQAHLERVRARIAEQEAAHLEQLAAGSPDYSWPPAPNTEHPGLARVAGVARELMERGEYQVRFALPQRIQIGNYDPDEIPDMPQTRTGVLNVQKARGPAPWTERPYAWTWKVAVDSANRWVAGDSSRVLMDGWPS